jgi:hypothetical protein
MVFVFISAKSRSKAAKSFIYSIRVFVVAKPLSCKVVKSRSRNLLSCEGIPAKLSTLHFQLSTVPRPQQSEGGLNSPPSTLRFQLSTFNFHFQLFPVRSKAKAGSTLHLQLSTFNSQLSTFNSQLSTVPRPQQSEGGLNSPLSTLHFQLSTLNFQLSTLN